MKAPTYTIAIPVYMRILGFKNALESALLVDGVTEILVVDDNSNHDEFERICNSFNDDRIKYFKNKENAGLFANWNKCIQKATGDFVSILCSDDLIEPNAYKLFEEAYNKKNNIDVFFGSFATFSNDKKDAIYYRHFKPGPMKGKELLQDAILNGPRFPVLTITRRSTLLKYPFVSSPHSGNDWLWIYSNAMNFNLYATKETINYWRRHPDQDAVKSQSITTDCWPLMFQSAQEKLFSIDKSLSNKAFKRSKGVILTWLINDFKDREGYFKRLLGEEANSNLFLKESMKIIDKDWLLKKMLYSKKPSSIYYNVGRLARKIGYYPTSV
ncbi:glycosyltransferase [Flavobacterium johnsoniae]|uniref:glycosyltransferase family 2 protein n=1 Tax=Flavobacterium johnsoniae TaxID=986 RepID=UPI0025AFA0F3|nr:glycosyltransferase family 2 protein [Flavobacterium johnsoniae]WJS94221.1 glycosyltransferase [Flavobacterium johnsoniae]